MTDSLPTPVAPMLATPGSPPEGDGWAYEWKWDGVRAVVGVAPGAVRAMSRTGRDITGSYPELGALAELVGAPVLLDGELIALDAAGRPNFGTLQIRMHMPEPTALTVRTTPVTFYVFDLLAADGQSLLAAPYLQRRDWLTELDLNQGPIRTPAHVTDLSGTDMLAIAAEHGLEGIVAKQVGSGYEPGRRARTWIKTPLRPIQEVIVGGWTSGEGRRAGTFGSLLIGVYDDAGHLRYAGHVGTGFTEPMLVDLHARLLARQRSTSPFDEPVPREHARHAHWVRPDLVGEVEYRTWTADGRLRAASWRGLAPDREPGGVRRVGTW